MEVRGLSIGPGLPHTVTVRSEEIREALRDPLQSIQDSIRQILEQTPPELAGDLVDRGIVMAGGGALLRGIDRLVAKETGLPVIIADDPLISVANGTGQVLQNIDYWRNAAGTGL
jgi:rod shape-determining protein MreB